MMMGLVCEIYHIMKWKRNGSLGNVVTGRKGKSGLWSAMENKWCDVFLMRQLG